MAKQPEKRLGRPPNPDTPQKTLGSVRVTNEQLERFSKAAGTRGKSRADWIRDTLDNAASRALK